jgi:hypothetical protein
MKINETLAVITGGASGLGKAVAQRIIAMGSVNLLVNCAGIAGAGKLLGKDRPRTNRSGRLLRDEGGHRWHDPAHCPRIGAIRDSLRVVTVPNGRPTKHDRCAPRSLMLGRPEGPLGGLLATQPSPDGDRPLVHALQLSESVAKPLFGASDGPWSARGFDVLRVTYHECQTLALHLEEVCGLPELLSIVLQM